MYTEQQYQRDIARIEAHKLALKDDAFNNYLVELIRKVVRERFEYLRDQRGVKLTLYDQAFESMQRRECRRLAHRDVRIRLSSPRGDGKRTAFRYAN